MKIAVTQSGENKSILLPEKIVKEYHFGKEIEIELLNNGVLLKNPQEHRKGWSKLFSAEVHEPEVPFLKNPSNLTDDEEWTW